MGFKLLQLKLRAFSNCCASFVLPPHCLIREHLSIIVMKCLKKKNMWPKKYLRPSEHLKFQIYLRNSPEVIPEESMWEQKTCSHDYTIITPVTFTRRGHTFERDSAVVLAVFSIWNILHFFPHAENCLAVQKNTNKFWHNFYRFAHMRNHRAGKPAATVLWDWERWSVEIWHRHMLQRTLCAATKRGNERLTVSQR